MSFPTRDMINAFGDWTRIRSIASTIVERRPELAGSIETHEDVLTVVLFLDDYTYVRASKTTHQMWMVSASDNDDIIVPDAAHQTVDDIVDLILTEYDRMAAVQA